MSTASRLTGGVIPPGRYLRGVTISTSTPGGYERLAAGDAYTYRVLWELVSPRPSLTLGVGPGVGDLRRLALANCL